jgi:Mrp family chromosome partitioning ATPase
MQNTDVKTTLTVTPNKGYLSAVADMTQFMEMRRCIDRIFERADSPRVLAVGSLAPAEGKTTFCLAAAMSLSERYGRKVLVVDTANLSRTGSVSLDEVCGVDADKPFAVQELKIGTQGVSYVWIPPSIKGSQSLKAQIANIARDFDTVLIDTCALSVRNRLENDPFEMASFADAMVLLRSESQIEVEQDFSWLEELKLSGVKVLGVVSNRFGGVK